MRETISRTALLKWMNARLSAWNVPDSGAFFSEIHPMRNPDVDPNWHVAYRALRELPDDPDSALQYEPQIRDTIEHAMARFKVDWDADEEK